MSHPGLNVVLKDGDLCEVIGGTHKGKLVTVTDINTNKTGHIPLR